MKMKEFYKRVRNAWDDNFCFDNETLPFKIFRTFFFTIGFLGFIVFCMAAFFTVPLWGIPYVIYCCYKDKKGV